MIRVTRFFPSLRVMLCLGAAFLSAAPAVQAASQHGARRGLAIGVQAEAPQPRISGYALILNMRADPAKHPLLPGLSRDVEHARAIAAGFGVAEANMKVFDTPEMSAAALLEVLSEMAARAAGDEEILIHFSGYGTTACNGVVREPALLMADGSALLESQFDAQLGELAARVRRVIAFIDIGRGEPETDASAGVLVSKYRISAGECPQTGKSRGLALGKDPLVNGNVVKLSGVSPGEAAFDSAESGGLASLAWAQCMTGAAQDSDASSGISVHELQACASRTQRDLVALLTEAQAAPVPESAEPVAAGSLQGNAEMVIADAVPDQIDANRSGPDPLAALQDILANRDVRRDVSLKPGQDAYRIGKDYVQFEIRSSHAGHVYLLMLGSDGKTFDLLFPNRKDADNRIDAGASLQLPRPSWRLKPGGPAGVNHVLVLVSDTPRDFSGLELRSAGPFSLVATTLANTRGLRMMSEAAPQAPNCRAQTRSRSLFIEDAEDVAAPKTAEKPADPACSSSYGAALIEIKEIE
jgi:hypothetical protein